MIKTMGKFSRFEELILFILDRADKERVKNLSDFQFMKILYLIEVFSLKYAGMRFIDEIFTRNKNGPITINFYPSREKLCSEGYIAMETIPNIEYGHPRNSNALGEKRIDKFSFTIGETIFLDNFLSDLLPLSQKELKEMAYETEPMKVILKEEKNTLKKGVIIDFNKIVVDPDVIEVYSDAS